MMSLYRGGESRYLITTSDEKTWKFDRPVLFLGEWCRKYDRKSVWQIMDAILPTPYGSVVDQRKTDLEYINDLARTLLAEITELLNLHHGVCHGRRYWHIMLGSWLLRYIKFLFNRYATLSALLDSYSISGCTLYRWVPEKWLKNDSLGFLLSCDDDEWNSMLYGRILEFIGADIYLEYIDPDPVTLESEQAIWGRRSNSLRHGALELINRLSMQFRRDEDAFVIGSYLSRQEELKFYLALGQFPQFWRTPFLDYPSLPEYDRKSISLDTGKFTGFERLVRLLLPEMLPKCYVEFYPWLTTRIDELTWPKKPKFIFTSNNFDFDELFKAWTASMTEKGITYFVGQHGNNYGTMAGTEYWTEAVSCDRFITWGWDNGKKKNKPAFIFRTSNFGQRKNSKQEGLLLIELHAPHRLGPEDVMHDFNVYQEEQFRFVDSLPNGIRAHLTVRLHGAWKYKQWFDDKRWHDYDQSISVETGQKSIKELIQNSRFVVHSYDSTGILETLALNIPTICFWQGGLSHLLPNAIPFYEKLRAVGIVAASPEDAAATIARYWNRVDEWWNGELLQEARKCFCDQYARIEKYPGRSLAKKLIECSKDMDGIIDPYYK